MSEPSSARSGGGGDEEPLSGRPEQDDEEEQQQEEAEEENGGAAAGASASVSPRAADAASPAESGVETNGLGKHDEEESKRHDDDDNDAAQQQQQQRQQRSSGDGQDADADADGDPADSLQQAAQQELEELEPEAEQGSQTQQQQRQQQRHAEQQAGDGDDAEYPDGVGSDSYVPRGPERQDYDDGGAEPDAERGDDGQQEEDDPAAADYDNADRGQFDDPRHGAGGADAAPAYVMPDVLKVVINREELEQEAEEEEERELAEQANGFPSSAPRTSFERTPEQVVYVQVIKDHLHHPKSFLGGFRHKYYGTVYHHAATQTARKKKKAERVKFHRETQTIQIVSRSQQTNREAGTQMERSDLLQDHSNDRVILSRPYFTADELEALRDNKAREVQCFLRQCFAWRRVRRLREAKADQVEQEQRQAAEKAAKEQAEHAAQIQRRMHPRTKADFAVLFAELEAWRLHETARIKESAGLSAEEVAVALQELLHKEVKLLQTIDRLKITAARENKWARTHASLEAMASPKEWSSREGDRIEVDTPFTTRAKELVDLYNGLLLRSLPRAQRVDVLLHVKYTVKEFDCALSRDIVDLIKREEDLLRRQRSEQSLEGLRRRLQNLFLHFVNTPQFNPEAANFQRVAEPGVVAAAAAAGAGAATGAEAAAARPPLEPPAPALSSSLAKPAMLTKSNTVTVASNVAGRSFAAKAK
jgi:hypothetical protein